MTTIVDIRRQKVKNATYFGDVQDGTVYSFIEWDK